MLYKESVVRSQYSECVFCGCTQDDCSDCVEKTGKPCHWICDGLCSACVKGVKALSIRQPWAWLIVNGYKTIENRTWRTNYRGPFLIHASKTFDVGGFEWVVRYFPGIPIPGKESITTKGALRGHYRTGGFVGMSKLVCMVTKSTNAFFTGPWGYKLRNSQPIEFIEYSGSLRFFNVPDEVVSNIQLITAN